MPMLMLMPDADELDSRSQFTLPATTPHSCWWFLLWSLVPGPLPFPSTISMAITNESIYFESHSLMNMLKMSHNLSHDFTLCTLLTLLLELMEWSLLRFISNSVNLQYDLPAWINLLSDPDCTVPVQLMECWTRHGRPPCQARPGQARPGTRKRPPTEQ